MTITDERVISVPDLQRENAHLRARVAELKAQAHRHSASRLHFQRQSGKYLRDLEAARALLKEVGIPLSGEEPPRERDRREAALLLADLRRRLTTHADRHAGPVRDVLRLAAREVSRTITDLEESR